MAEADIKKVLTLLLAEYVCAVCHNLKRGLRSGWQDFFHHVNLTLKELEAWLDSETSMNTGLAAEGGEPKGENS